MDPVINDLVSGSMEMDRILDWCAVNVCIVVERCLRSETTISPLFPPENSNWLSGSYVMAYAPLSWPGNAMLHDMSKLCVSKHEIIHLPDTMALEGGKRVSHKHTWSRLLLFFFIKSVFYIPNRAISIPSAHSHWRCARCSNQATRIDKCEISCRFWMAIQRLHEKDTSKSVYMTWIQNK